MMALFGGKKPDYTRIEQKEPPEETLPPMPNPNPTITTGTPQPQQQPQANMGPQEAAAMEAEKVALFEWHWARAIQLYQELKGL